jgi:hypothetical protein
MDRLNSISATALKAITVVLGFEFIQAPEVNSSLQGRGAIALKFEKDAYATIEILFVVGCLPLAQHRLESLLGSS